MGYTSHSGLALIGLALNRYTCLKKELRAAGETPLKDSDAGADSHFTVGQLALGKSDFDAIENVRKDKVFQRSLGIARMPSSALDSGNVLMLQAREIIPYWAGVRRAWILIRQTGAPISALSSGHCQTLDMDGFPMDNSRTKKEALFIPHL